VLLPLSCPRRTLPQSQCRWLLDNPLNGYQEFSVPTGNEAFFNNADTIDNIITRVTGGSKSNIDGLIRAKGSANLFLINPAGIIFGPNASLNIGGSFLGSTADSIVFPEGEFSATDTQTSPLLTINAPIGLRFRETPREIVNKSRVKVDSELIGRSDTSDSFTTGLQVKPGETLALVGGDIVLDGGNLTANEGRIELGSVGENSSVSITFIEQGFALGYDRVENFRDINFFSGTIVDTSGEVGGEIQLQGRQITLTGDALGFDPPPVLVFSNTVGEGQGGTLTVKASEAIELSGDFTALWTQIEGTGNAGNLVIDTGRLTVRDGGFIQSASESEGRAGDIRVTASESIEMVGTTSDEGIPTALATFANDAGDAGNLTIITEQLTARDGGQISTSTLGSGKSGDLTVNASDIRIIGTSTNDVFSSAIFAQAEPDSTGNAGNLVIETERLTIQNGGFVSSSTFNSGQGGNLTVNASDSITLSGTAPTADLIRGSSGLFVLADEFSSGNGGNLSVTTGQLIVEDGAKISAETFGTGNAGDATLDVSQLIVRNGGQVRASSLLGSDDSNLERGAGGTLTINATDSIEVTGTGDINGEPVKSSLFTLAEGTGDAGDLTITTNKLTVADGGEINASAMGTGAAGNLTITANNINLDRGQLTATTAAGTGGNIDLNVAENLIMRDNSQISAQATGKADGGNVTINSDFIVAFPNQNNDILASAEAGKGGNIDIIANGIFGLEERKQNPLTNDIDASSEFSLDGEVTINTPDVEVFQETAETPENIVDSERVVAGVCNSAETARDILEGTQNTFIVKGKGGVPPEPTEPFSGEVLIIDGEAISVAAQPQEINSDRDLTLAEGEIDIDKIIPAQGIVRTEDGEVWLVGYATPNSTPRYPQNSRNCGGM
jgi:filamentous hemagglutinin family protein